MTFFPTKGGPKESRTLTPPSFQRLLSWLDEGTNSDGQNYLEIRRRLVAYFHRRNCSNFQKLADETLNRVTEEEGTIESHTPANYCYVVARFVRSTAFGELSAGDQFRLLEFLNSLVVFPPNDIASNLDPGNRHAVGFPRFGHGRVKLTALFTTLPTSSELS